jgi:hypothetical protein
LEEINGDLPEIDFGPKTTFCLLAVHKAGGEVLASFLPIPLSKFLGRSGDTLWANSPF